MKNWYLELSKVDISGFIEKKNGLSYLSWALSWNELKRRYPLSFSTVYEAPEGGLVWPDPIGGHVKTGVTIVWFEDDGTRCEHEAIEYLPVMDNRNQAISVENIRSTDINKTIQRSLTKCIARLGLGMCVYAGEDLPIEDTQEKEQCKAIISDITAALKAKAMEPEEKKRFTAEVIIPIIGEANFLKCTDVDKLKELLAKIKA